MKKILVSLLLVAGVICGCSHTDYIRKNPDFLKVGLHASAFLEVWGTPDETLAYLDYKNKQIFYSSGGSWSQYGGGYSSHASTYTPATLVWVYKNHGKALFFQRDLINTGVIPIYSSWALIGWENIRMEVDRTTIKRTKETPANWKLYSSTEFTYYYYDPQSVTRPSKNIAHVWVRWEITEKGVIDMVKRMGPRFEEASWWMTLEEINCEGKMVHSLLQGIYDTRGQVIASSTDYGNPPSWQYIVPGSVTDLLSKEICKSH